MKLSVQPDLMSVKWLVVDRSSGKAVIVEECEDEDAACVVIDALRDES